MGKVAVGGRIVALVVGLALVGTTPTVAIAAHARAPEQVEAGTMLELDAADAALGARVGASLRRAFARRGLDDGRRDSLVDLRLAMGCENDEPSCLAKGGRALGVERLIYGSLQPGADGVVLALSVLVVDAARVGAAHRVVLTAEDLEAANLDATAERVVVELLGERSVPAPVAVSGGAATVPTTSVVAAPPPPAPVVSKPVQTDAGPRTGKIWWGLERPTPKWKWALFGTSVGLLAASSAAAIGLSVSVRVRMRDRLVAAANDSLTDESPVNDVDPSVVNDICGYAREAPDDTMPDFVRNKSVVKECNIAETQEKGLYAAAAMAGISLAATLVFTGLLVMHRTPRRVQASVGMTPHGGGATLMGRF